MVKCALEQNWKSAESANKIHLVDTNSFLATLELNEVCITATYRVERQLNYIDSS